MTHRFFAAVGVLVIITVLGIVVIRGLSGYISTASQAVSGGISGVKEDTP